MRLGACIGFNVFDGWLCRLLEVTVVLTMTWFSVRLSGFFVCVWGNAKCCVYACVCLWDGHISINSATTKAAVQGYPHKAALILFCCNVSLPVSLSLTSLPHIYLWILSAYIPVSGFTSRTLWYDTESAGVWALVSLQTRLRSLSLKEQH